MRHLNGDGPVSWRDMVLDPARDFSIRRATRRAMVQEGWGAWEAFKRVRRYAIIHGTWPAPTKESDYSKSALVANKSRE